MYRFAGRLRRLTLGSHPPLGLADARELARDALRKAALGKDPAAEKLGLRTADSFEELAVRYMERHAKVKKRSWREDQRVIDKHLLPKWRNVRARDITRRDVIALLDGIADNTPILANRIRAQISKMFNWAISRDLVDHNPCHQVPRPGQEHRRDRVLTEDEIKRLWKALDAERLITAATFRLRLITAQRGAEVLSMEWPEVDLDTNWWTIPPQKSKNGLAHRVPLSAPAIRVLEQIRARKKTKHSDVAWVFPNPKRNGPISNVRKAAIRLNMATGIGFTPHDLRRTAASMMTSMEVPRLTVQKILNHVERGVTAVYDRHSYDKEKREALEAWGRRLQMIVSSLRDVSGDPKQ